MRRNSDSTDSVVDGLAMGASIAALRFSTATKKLLNQVLSPNSSSRHRNFFTLRVVAL
jgi:hypothetical protein